MSTVIKYRWELIQNAENNLALNSAYLSRCVENNRKLYFFGGKNGKEIRTSETVSFDPTSLKWTKLSSHPEGVSVATLISFDNKILCVGGLKNDKTTNLVYEYNIDNDAWVKKANFPANIRYASGIYHNGLIYIAGGMMYSTGVFNTLYAYDPIDNSWSKKANMPIASGVSINMHLYNDAFYHFGQMTYYDSPIYKFSDANQKYQISTNTWAKVNGPTMNCNPWREFQKENIVYILVSDSEIIEYNLETETYESYLIENPMPLWGAGFNGTFYGSFASMSDKNTYKLVLATPSVKEHSITVEYVDQNDKRLQADATYYVSEGENITIDSGTITNYLCIGYRLDGGEVVLNNEVMLQNILENHLITFIYKSIEPESPTYEPVKGCANVKVEINGCSNNALVKKICQIIDISECDCTCDCACSSEHIK